MEDELVISVTMIDNDAPIIKILVNGTPLGVLQKVLFEADSKNFIPKMEFTILSPDVDDEEFAESINNSIDLLSKFLPVVTIIEKDFDGNCVRARGQKLDWSSTLGESITVSKLIDSFTKIDSKTNSVSSEVPVIIKR